jgi:hypothetical protein
MLYVGGESITIKEMRRWEFILEEMRENVNKLRGRFAR